MSTQVNRMKSSRRLLLAAILVMLPIAAVVWPADEVRVTSFVTTAKQDGPLQIVGFKLPEKVGHPPMAVVRNVSSKQILEFTIDVIIGNPGKGSLTGYPNMPFGGGLSGVGVSPTSPVYAQWRKERSIPPGGVGETLEGGLGSNHSVLMATLVRSNCVHSLPMVSRVEFADGTHWKWSPSWEQLNQIWKDSILPESLKSCDNSQRVTELMKQLRGPAYNLRDSLTHADTAIVQHYSISCPLRRRHGEMFALCPL